MPGWKLYEVPGYDGPLRLSPDHAEALGGTLVEPTALPPKSATKATWAEYAKGQGLDPATADSMTRADLIATYAE